MKYWPAYFITTICVVVFAYFSLSSERLADTAASSDNSGVVNTSSAPAQLQSATPQSADKKAQYATQQLAVNNAADLKSAKSSNNEPATTNARPDLNQQAQRFAANALANGYFSVDDVDAMLLGDNFDELAAYLSYQHDDDIQVRLDIEQQLANTLTDGAVINNINCGSYICFLSIDAGNNDDIESVVNTAINSDNKIKTVVYRSLVTNGQQQLRAVLSYNERINAVVVPFKTGS
jgi:hypothetical protein